MVRKRIQLAQNFLKSSTLIWKLISKTSINDQDIVYEIGAGSGIITRELIKKAGKVIVIELDKNLIDKMIDIFGQNSKVEIHQGNFLGYQLSSPKYKVFSNIPFNITSDIVRKLLYSSNTPEDAYLILQQEAAMKFSGNPTETEFSILAKPWFTFESVWDFQRTDFFPVPSVNVSLLHIHKRENPLVSNENADLYRLFVKYGFGAWKKDLKTAYKDIFSYEQWKRLSKDNRFPIKAIPTQLTFEQWIKLFEFLLKSVPPNKRNNLNKLDK